VPYELLFLGDLVVDCDGFSEDGETFRENAAGKARFFAEKTGFLTVGEDSGLLVDALEGELGVRTRRWGAGEEAGDQEWIDYFLERMEGETERGAKFVCCACFFDGENEEYFEGEVRGKISHGLEVPILPGIPLSSCFVPEGCDRVYAALTSEEKNRLSHRGKAMFKLKGFLAKGA